VVRRQRRGLALAVLLVLAAVATIVATSAGRKGGARASAGARAPVRARPRPPAVDRVLGYTDYVLAGSPRRREVALTFDDGPSPYTAKVLAILRRTHTDASFFPVGRPIAAFPRGLAGVRRAGFPVGDHTMTHPLMGHLGAGAQAGEIDGQARLLTRHEIAYPRFFRPPDGSFDGTTRALLQRRRMLMVLWSVNPEDYFRPGAAQIVGRVMRGARPGAIVLMHDGGGDRSQTVAALPTIIRRLRARGLTPVSIPQLLQDDPPPHHQPPPPNLAGV